MNTSKQINIMILVVFLAVFATGAYTLWDPDRATDAEAKQVASTVERGAYLFSQNCRTCHGDSGEGGSKANRLRLAPPLNRPDLQGLDANGNVDEVEYANDFKFVYNTIACGRVGKLMPAWSQAQGGTLNDEQVKQLATLILRGAQNVFGQPATPDTAEGAQASTPEAQVLTGWEAAREFAIRGVPHFARPGDDQYGLVLAANVQAGDTVINLNHVTGKSVAGSPPPVILSSGERLSIGDEILTIQEINPQNNTVTVERGVGSTSPADYAKGTEVLKPPVPPTGAINEKSCGQLAGAATTPVTEQPSAQLSIIAKGIAWNKTTLAALAGVPLTLTLDNQDAGTPHNIVFFNGPDNTAPEVARTEIQNGPITETLNFGPLDAGDYFFYCEVHPQMEGVLTAGAGGATTPAAGGTPTPAGTTTPGGSATPAATPSAGASPAATQGAVGDGDTTLQLVAKNTLFDKTSLEAPSGRVLIQVDNQDGGIAHNIEVYLGADETGELMGGTEIENGPVQQELELSLAPGSYFYWCVVHPATMNGKLTIN